MHPTDPASPPDDSAILAIERPAPALMVYYTFLSASLILILPVALVVWVANYFRYSTLRYRFDDQGISMRWGILFRKEILLSYARIQDIHLVSNFLERHLGIARIQIQTASGSATPEMTIEGLHEFEAVRDFLYARMRGTQGVLVRPQAPTIPAAVQPDGLGHGTAPAEGELAAVLRQVAGEVRALREHLESRSGQ